MVNTAKVHMPENYHVPEHITKGRAKDFAMSYWLTKEIGVVAMYVSPWNQLTYRPPTEFYTKEHCHLAQDWLRFAVCKDLDTLEEAVVRLRKLKQYIRD
jgi:kynurenine aminotransferase